MSNKALKNYLICFGVLVVVGLIMFAVSKSNSKETTPVEETKTTEKDEITDHKDINGNTIVEINGEKSVYLE